MANQVIDQAEGLRRMLAAPRISLCTVLCADGHEQKAALMDRLAASMVRRGRAVILLDARTPAIAHQVTLRAVARGEATLKAASTSTPEGFDRMLLGACFSEPALENLVAQIASHQTRILVDAELNAKGTLPLQIFADGELVVQLSGSPASIKQAYAMLRTLKSVIGSGTLSILVTGSDAVHAQKVHANLSQAASRYLALTIKSIVAPTGGRHV